MRALPKAVVWFDTLLLATAFCLTSVVSSVNAEPIRLLSVADPSQGPPAGGNGNSGTPIFSREGRYVVFASAANNLVLISNRPMPVAAGPRLNVFVRDRTAATTVLATFNLSGSGGGDGDSLPRDISTNGRYVLIESSASNLVTGDTNNQVDVFVRDLVTGSTILVSVGTNGTAANAESRSSVITPDGRYVAFTSDASNLVANDTNGIADVFRRDLQTGTTVLVSVGARSRAPVPITGAPPMSLSDAPRMSSNGRYVAFYSTATNLNPGFRANAEIFVRDLQTGVIDWVSPNPSGVVGVYASYAANSYSPAISEDGRYVAYAMSPNVNSATQTFVLRYDRLTTATDLITTNGDLPFGPLETMPAVDISADGRVVALMMKTNGFSGESATAVLVWDVETSTGTVASVNLSNQVSWISYSEQPMLDSSGRFVGFRSNATNLVGTVTGTNFHLYLRDLQSKVTQIVDVDSNGAPLTVEQTVPSMSANGRFFGFECNDAPVVGNDRNRALDVFVRDLVALTNELISARHPAWPAITPNGPSTLWSSSSSTNGQLIVFTSEADNLVANDTNGCRDVFLRDLLTGTNLLISVATNGTPGDASSTEPSISGDGRYVVFTSHADNLVAGDTNRQQDVFIRDVQGGTTALVSKKSGGTVPANKDSYSPTISQSGRYVLFHSRATDLALGIFFSGENIIMRDLQLGTNYAVTTNTGSMWVPSAMTPDGRYVMYGGILSGVFTTNVYVRDFQSPGSLFTIATSKGAASVALDATATHLAFTLAASSNNVIVANRVANTNWVLGTALVLSNGAGSFSGDGRYLAYLAVANGSNQVFLYDFQSGTNRLISKAYNSTTGANGGSDSVQISSDGRFVAFRSFASDLVPGDDNGSPDVFAYDNLTSTLTLLSAGTGESANNRSLVPMFMSDAQTALFESFASDLITQDLNTTSDLFSYRLVAGPIVDSDGDGLDDGWELEHFLTLARNGTGDFDNDGVTDWFEFRSGTDPTNAGSLFRIEMGVGVGGPNLTWPATVGKVYKLQFKDQLTEGSWQDYAGTIEVVGDHAYATDVAASPNQRFYRVIIL
jgi:Tol biopolymer transport system component